MTSKVIGALALGLALFEPHRAPAQAASPNAQAKLAAAIKEIRNETAQTCNQLQQTVDALDFMVMQKTGELRPSYNAFVAEVTKTRERRKRSHETGALEN